MRQAIGLSAVVLGALVAVSSAGSPPGSAPPASPPSAGDAVPASQPSAVDPVADQILRQSCAFLAQTRGMSVKAEVWKDEVLPSGHKIQVTRSLELDFRRPDRLHVVERAHHKGRSIWYDGKKVSVLEHEQNLYAVADAPDTVDALLDELGDTYGITVPLEDLLLADPYAGATKHVTAGGYFGDEPVLGVPCKHVGFSTDRIDWQLWVSDGPQPLPRKLVITYKTEEQSPQWTAVFTRWELPDRVADLAFEFIPPRQAVRIPMVSVNGKSEHEKKQ